jgi:hypothetical protein
MMELDDEERRIEISERIGERTKRSRRAGRNRNGATHWTRLTAKRFR